MNPFLAEFLGTAMLIILGNGVVANVVLNKTKGHNSGWIVITLGWAMAVFVSVFCFSQYSGAHLNPAVTLALAIKGSFEFDLVLPYILAQLAGAFIGAIFVFLLYKPHFDETEDGSLTLACFSTGPAIRNPQHNFFVEFFTTFIFILAIILLSSPDQSNGALSALPVALLVLTIGLCLGGPTGYAINPARDLGPRIAHTILPFNNKASSDWAYGWIPFFAPLCGGAFAALFYNYIF
jgi:glycerol uptake facilitator protein